MGKKIDKTEAQNRMDAFQKQKWELVQWDGTNLPAIIKCATCKDAKPFVIKKGSSVYSYEYTCFCCKNLDTLGIAEERRNKSKYDFPKIGEKVSITDRGKYLEQFDGTISFGCKMFQVYGLYFSEISYLDTETGEEVLEGYAVKQILNYK